MSTRAGARSIGTPAGRAYFQADDDGVVWVWTAKARLGGWRLERFGSKLDSAWITAWREACYPT